MDSFFGIGLMELFLIAVIALVVLGPERLPGAMRSIANFMRQVRDIGSEFTSQFSEEIKMIEEMDPRRMINEVLDPSKTPGPSKSQPGKPATSTNVAKSGAAAKPLAKNTVSTVSADKPEQNSILPPEATTPAQPVNQPSADPQKPADNAPPSPADDSTAQAMSDDNTSAEAEATR
ncbi:MAG: Sec-independent protein translocase protein TatB [Caldilinea sp.]